MGSTVVCFSAGVDSTFLLKVAVEQLGDRALAFTAISPSLPGRELEEAKQLARTLGARHALMPSAELDRTAYAENAPDRCYHCKSELMRLAAAAAQAEGLRWVALGTNVGDLGDHRPGLRAANEGAARHPLVEAGLHKAEIRALSRELGLPTWNKPEMACLASRFPYGTAITRERLGQVEALEAALAELGFAGTRVRYHGEVARIELPPEDLPRAVADTQRAAIVAHGRALGFAYVALDLQGYRRGALNEVLPAALAAPDAAEVARISGAPVPAKR
jgi:uncharacterized protein